MKAKYTKEYEGYNLTIGKTYEVDFYKKNYLMVKSDDLGNCVICRMDSFERNQFSFMEAGMHAIKFCQKNPKWITIADLATPEVAFDSVEKITFDMWEDLAKTKCKLLTGFITGKGKFCKKFDKVNKDHGYIQVFRIHSK